jgi:hypothetical protein
MILEIPNATPEQNALAHRLRRRALPCLATDEAELKETVAELLGDGFRFPDEPCCPDHVAPYDFLHALVFKRNRHTHRPEMTILGVAGRGTYKTLDLRGSREAIGAANGEQIAHIGAIKAQSVRCYGYVRKMLPKRGAAPARARQGHHGRLRLPLGRHARDPVVHAQPAELRPRANDPVRRDRARAARRGAGGPRHPLGRARRRALDRRDLEPEVQRRRRRAQDGDRGGRRPGGLHLVLQGGRRALPRLALRDRARHGLRRPRDNLEAYSHEDWSRLPASEREGFEPVEVFDKCLACPLLPSCRGDLKRATGTQKIDRLIAQFRQASRSFWIMQMESRQTTVEGAVFSSFRPEGTLRTHVRTSAEIGPIDPSRGPVWLSLDPGRHHPGVGLWQHVKRPGEDLGRYVLPGGLVCHDEVHDYRADMDLKLPQLEERILRMLARHGLERSDVTIACDPAGNQEDDLGESTVQWLEGRGWTVETPQAFIAERIDMIDARLKFVTGRPGLVFVKERTTAHVSSFKNYRNAEHRETGLLLDTPKKDNVNDHICDATGYLVSAIDMPRKRSRVGKLSRG